MTALLKEFDDAIQKIQPDRTYFFESIKGDHYSKDWVADNFSALWKKANPETTNAVAYDLRHHYAISNINSWDGDAFEFNDKLHFLSKSMGIDGLFQRYTIIQLFQNWLIFFSKKQRADSMRLFRRFHMKKNSDAVRIAMYINEFLGIYAKSFLTHSEHTIKSYKDTLTLYILFLQEKKVTPDKLSYQHFNKEWIEQWICWLKESRNCCSDTCNVRLGSLRVFLEFLGNKDIELIYLYQNAKNIKRQKIQKKKVEGLTRNAVSAILKEPDVSTKTGKRDIVFLTVLYATAGRLDEIRSIKVGHIHLDTDKPCIHLHGKGDKIRTSYLLPRAVEHIRVS